MGKYIPAIITGLVVTVLISFGLGFLGSVAGQPPGLATWMPGVIFGVLVAYVMSNLVGTKRAKAATSAAKDAVLAFRAEPGQALLIVFREGFVGMAAGMNVAVDDRPIAQLKSPRFTAVSVSPGPHKASARFTGLAGAQNRGAEHDFVAAAGDVIALRMVMSMGAMKNTINMERVDQSDSLALKLKSMTMVAPEA
jgi:hypothetical protein